MNKLIVKGSSRGRVAERKRSYKNDDEYSVSSEGEINILGARAIKGLIRDYNLNLDCDLYEITSVLVKRYDSSQRQRYDIDTTGQILNIIKYLKKQQKDGDK